MATFCVALSGCTSTQQLDQAERYVFAEPEKAAYPAKIKHAYGTTEVTAQPQRLVAIGWGGAEIALQFGTVPVAQGKAAGVDADYYPWVSQEIEKLKAPRPAVNQSLERGEVDIEYVLSQKPDLIVAINSGISDAEYKRLSEIAPTIAFPGQPWATSVDEHITMMGAALGRPSFASTIINDSKKRIAETADKHRELAGVTYLHSFLPADDGQVVVFGSSDPRTQVLEGLGLKPLDRVNELARDAGGEASFNVSMEQLLALEPEVLVVNSTDAEWKDALESHVAFAGWEPVAQKRVALIKDKNLSLAFSTATPLSIDWAIDSIADTISSAVKNR